MPDDPKTEPTTEPSEGSQAATEAAAAISVPKADFDALMQRLEALEQAKGGEAESDEDIFSPEYINKVAQGRTQEAQDTELSPEEIEGLSKADLLKLASERGKREALQELTQHQLAARQQENKRRIDREIRECQKTHPDEWEAHRTVMHLLAPRFSDTAAIEDVYQAAHVTLSQIRGTPAKPETVAETTATAPPAKPKSKETRTETPGSAIPSTSLEKPGMSLDEALENAWQTTTGGAEHL